MSDNNNVSPGPSEQIIVDLEAGSEWRFELEADENIALRVLSPDPVFINSEELPPASWYPIHRHTKGALYAPTPARVEVTSLPASQYTSTSTIQPQLLNLHLALERTRILAKRYLNDGIANEDGVQRGSRVMIVGPPSSGKTTVVKNLVNLALSTGMGWTPGVVGLDPSSPSNLIPGTLSLSTPSHPIPTHHPAHPMGSPPTSTPSNMLSADVPTIGWWLGALEPTNKNAEVWRALVERMGAAWRKRCEKDKIALASGLIVDTSSAFTNPLLGTKKDDPKARYSLVTQAVEAFGIDTILVIGHEKLHIDLSRLSALQSLGTVVLRIPKSGGVVDLDDNQREIINNFQVRSYFYGEPPLPPQIAPGGGSSAGGAGGMGLIGKMVGLDGGLSPYSFQIGWETLVVLRVGEENSAPSSALPLGSSRILSPTRLTRVDPAGPAHVVRLLNTVLAIVQITPQDRITPAKTTELATDGKAKTEATDAEGVKKETGTAEGEAGGDVEGEEEEAVAEDLDAEEVPFVEEIGTREVLGFIVITGIDAQKKKYTVLSPSPGKLPSTVALAGSIEWVDSA
ncbi:mRNA cleavage and polyadenylation factor Clp1 [Kwoniella heveanensis BCC8398]|uniref:Polynucleotide 5'-hydroxyl-kinase GRC3 n=1 Tax=Kwoniella heveanensis BCC8398 TaxID=1296120 RepID=A0A1B9H3H8_9TREE|nr:mRNA cleavage and polyadenylation factor Clp1 [Kwoniella heveanensis BCC8398]